MRVLLGMKALARQLRPWSAIGCTTATIRIASHRSPARSPTGSTGFLANGLTKELFDLLLDAQQNACGMCHDPFEDGQLIHVDHDLITRAAGRRTDRAESAYGDSCAIPAISRWATSNADMRWLAPTWTALPSGSSPPPSLQLGDCRSPPRSERRDRWHNARTRGLGQVGGHDQRRPPVEGARGDQHSPVADGDQLGNPALGLFLKQRHWVRTV